MHQQDAAAMMVLALPRRRAKAIAMKTPMFKRGRISKATAGWSCLRGLDRSDTPHLLDRRQAFLLHAVNDVRGAL